MMCEECHVRPATIHITKIVNNEKVQMHLCEVCAKQKHLGFPMGFSIFGIGDFGDADFSMGKLLSSFFEPVGEQFDNISTGVKCEGCGLTFDDFIQTGRFGCSKCYTTFKEQINPLLRRIHGKTYHVGKVPRRTGGQLRIKHEIDRLKAELQEAVNAEEYERAAVIRDKIKQLEEIRETKEENPKSE